MEPLQKQDFKFKSRFVLASSAALQTYWRFVNSLSPLAQKPGFIQKNQGALDPQETQNKNLQKIKAKTYNQEGFTPDIPAETTNPLGLPLTRQPSIQSLKGKNQQNNVIKIKPHNSLPTEEEERVAETEDNVFPERVYEEDPVMTMEEAKQKTFNKKTQQVLNKQTGIKKLSSDSSANRQKAGFEPSVSQKKETTKTFHILLSNDYENLWKQTTPFFCSLLILNLKKDKVYAKDWSGKITVNQKDQALANLTDYSLFKVCQRGHPYHGFVVDLPANKAFFNKIGWDMYPKHITAIPIKNEKQELKQIFVGLRTSPLSREKIKEMEKIVSSFFQSQKIISQAA